MGGTESVTIEKKENSVSEKEVGDVFRKPLPNEEISRSSWKIVGGFGGKESFYGYKPPDIVELSPVVFSLDSPHSVNEDIFTTTSDSDKRLDSFKNYGVVPILVIHHTLLYLQPTELLSCMMTCQLFLNVTSTNLFWKNYYCCFFNEDLKKKKNNIFPKETYNWKKQFFKRYREGISDFSLRRNWNIRKMTKEETDVARTERFFTGGTRFGVNLVEKLNIYMLGKKGIGKRRLIHKLFNNNNNNEKIESEEEENKEREDVFYFKFLRRKKNKQEEEDEPTMELPRFTQYPDIDFKVDVKEELLVEVDNVNEPINYYNNGLYYVAAFFLCFSLDDRESFEYLQKFISDVSTVGNMKDGGIRIPKGQHRYNTIVMGMKSDLPLKERKISREEIRRFVKMNNFKGYVEVSSEFRSNLLLPFGVIIQKAMKNRIHRISLSKCEIPGTPSTRVIDFDRMNLRQMFI